MDDNANPLVNKILPFSLSWTSLKSWIVRIAYRNEILELNNKYILVIFSSQIRLRQEILILRNLKFYQASNWILVDLTPSFDQVYSMLHQKLYAKIWFKWKFIVYSFDLSNFSISFELTTKILHTKLFYFYTMSKKEKLIAPIEI